VVVGQPASPQPAEQAERSLKPAAEQARKERALPALALYALAARPLAKTQPVTRL